MAAPTLGSKWNLSESATLLSALPEYSIALYVQLEVTIVVKAHLLWESLCSG